MDNLARNNIFGWGQLNPKLSFNFLAGGWNGVAVDVLVEGVGGVKDSVVRYFQHRQGISQPVSSYTSSLLRE